MAYDSNLIFCIFALMLAGAIPFLIFIALMSREKHRDAGFHVSRASDDGVHGDVVIHPMDRRRPVAFEEDVR